MKREIMKSLQQYLFIFLLSNVVGKIYCVEIEKLFVQGRYQLGSPRITNIGEWGPFEICPGGQVVVGMRLKTQRYQGEQPVYTEDDTALNGISFICGSTTPWQQHSTGNSELKSYVGYWGEWGQTFWCSGSGDNGYAIGFQLRSQSYSQKVDNTAANNLRLICNSRRGVFYVEGDGMPWGEWTQQQICPRGTAVCAMRTQVEPARRNWDNTALNNLDVQCCEI